MKLQITPYTKCSAVRVGRIFVRTISINLSIDPKNVCFLDTVLSTKVTSVFTSRQIVFTFLVMLCSMRLSSRFPRSHHPLILPSPSCTLFQFFLINLWMLYILLCCCLTMVQALVVGLVWRFWKCHLPLRRHRLHPRHLLLCMRSTWRPCMASVSVLMHGRSTSWPGRLWLLGCLRHRRALQPR